MQATAVIALIALALFFIFLPVGIRKFREKAYEKMGQTLTDSKFISAIAVGPNQKVVTLEVGPKTKKSWIVIGVTPQNIHCLHTIPIESVPIAESSEEKIPKEESKKGKTWSIPQ